MLAVAFCLLAAIWPASAQAADTDGDGLEDSVETNTGVYVSPSATGTDPGNPDTDGDEMPDGWEVANGLDPNADDADGNPDGDGLTNLQEFIFGTDPQTYDPVETMIAFAVVGDPGNPDDDQTTPEGAERDKDNENGGVGYVGQTFGIGETEITNEMYARFLNAAAKRDRLYSLYSTLMNDDDVNGGIGRSGTDGSYVYTVYAGWEDKPVNYISGFDAKRFCNWLHNGMPGDPEAEDPAKRTPLTGDQNASSTEDGAYTLLGANEDQIIRRNLGARYHLPDQDEFHKAGYYDPDGGIDHNNPVGRPRSSESYWWFADQSMIGPGGNYDTYDAGTALGERRLLADVATFRASVTSTGKSHYGTFDQDGNVNEWLDAAITGTVGNEQYFVDQEVVDPLTDTITLRYTAQDPLTENYKLGFRVARRMPDEPSEQVVVPLAVEIGEPENHDDEEFGPELDDEQIGAVNYPFQMGAYEVTNRDYVRFLNDKAKDDHLYHLYDTRMGSDEVNGGIKRIVDDNDTPNDPSDDFYCYTVKHGFGRKPVVYISIFSAMRYCNWLHNGGGPGSDMETGAYRLLGNIPPNTDQLTRNATARYYLPNASEYYKSAYYDPDPAATGTFDYWKYATRRDQSDPVLNSAALANVDAHVGKTNAASYFGTYGQSGNVGYVDPGSGANTAAPKPTAANTGELLEEATNTDDESATRTFRIAAAANMDSLDPNDDPNGDADGDGLPNGWEVLGGLDPYDNGVDNVRTLAPNDGHINNGPAGDADINPLTCKSDPDGLNNLQEYERRTDPLDPDSDGDGLKDGVETNTGTYVSLTDTGTDPNNPDTDDDGLKDGVETNTGIYVSATDTGTDPHNPDSDGDTLEDGAETGTGTYVSATDTGTDPNKADTDGDQMPDDWEVGYGLNPNDPADAGSDGEPDGLTNLQEYNAGTNPNKADTDEDGLKDGVETNTGVYVAAADTGTDPNNPDTDDDGLKDGVETNTGVYVSATDTGTDPHNPDSDGDTLKDGVETGTGTYVSVTDAGTDPNKPDTDDDGLKDGVETNTGIYVSATDTGTDPHNPDSDDDGLKDGVETNTGIYVSAENTGTKPNISDTDNDGMSDYWEVYYGRDPVSGTDRDTDNDGASDADEIAAGTDPMTFNTPAAAPAMVTVGAAGNVANGTNGGAVAYEYRIGTYEVTNEDYARFLNAAARVSDAHNLYDTRMSFSSQDDPTDTWDLSGSGGIIRTGTAGSYLYTVKSGFARKPVNFVSYDSALRYCNWLHNGGTDGADTEKGAYDMDPNSDNFGQRITEWARFWMPDQREWYKAAAYDVSAGPRYWNYAVRADSVTTSQVAVRPSTELVNVYEVINISGTFPAQPSYFGTYGQSGNAAEWIEVENAEPAAFPYVRGGSILSFNELQYENVGGDVRTTTSFQPLNGRAGRYDIGFRIASLQPVTLPVPPAFSARYPGIKPTDRMDGLPALLDYLLGGSASAPPAKTNLPTQTLADGKIRYSFVVRTDDPSLAYGVQTATDLNGPWTTDNVTELSPEPVAGNLSRRTFEIPVNGDRQRFFRLVVEQN